MAPQGKDQDRMGMMVEWGLQGTRAVITDKQFLGYCLVEELGTFV